MTAHKYWPRIASWYLNVTGSCIPKCLLQKNIYVTYVHLLLVYYSVFNACSIDFGVRQGSVLSPVLFALLVDDVSSICTTATGGRGCIILYADDILLIAPSVTMLERLLHICEDELDYIDMVINYKKSSCIRIGPRCDVSCATVRSNKGHSILWLKEMRYLGIFIVCSRVFRCNLHYAKRNFYPSANAIFW